MDTRPGTAQRPPPNQIQPLGVCPVTPGLIVVPGNAVPVPTLPPTGRPLPLPAPPLPPLVLPGVK